MGGVHYVVDAKNVTHEILDGEVVAINLPSGCYYSMSGVAGTIWELVGGGLNIRQMAEHIRRVYAVDEATALRDLTSFCADLEQEGLLIQRDLPSEPDHTFPQKGDLLPYATPCFERFDDMKEMLILDPIHDVSEAGWPFTKNQA